MRASKATMTSRRNVLIGFGATAAGSGVLMGTGAFTQVRADRDLSVHVADDDEGVIELTEGDVESATVDGSGSAISFDLEDGELGDASGVNADAEISIGEIDGAIDETDGITSSAFDIRVDNDNNEISNQLNLIIEVENQSTHDIYLHLDDGSDQDVVEDNGSNMYEVSDNEELDLGAAFGIKTDDSDADVDTDITLTLERENPTGT